MPILPWDEELAWESRDMAPLAWTRGISLADRACLGLARHLGTAAMTSDTEWAKLGLDVRSCFARATARTCSLPRHALDAIRPADHFHRGAEFLIGTYF
jgi:hypothetical protein